MRHVEDVRAGRWVIMVLAPKREARTIAGDILSVHGAEFVGFYGRWAWEGLTPSSGPAAADGATKSDALPARPEQWTAALRGGVEQEDPDALASLFDSHAESVNVTGLWWYDRASIRKAHAYGLERIFNASTLTVDELRVKQLSDDVAIVHAAMTLSGQTAIAAIRQPGSKERPSSPLWCTGSPAAGLCASAHNTDAVPNMETNVVGEDGAVRRRTTAPAWCLMSVAAAFGASSIRRPQL